MKEDNKSPHPKPGKPGSSGPSAARIAAHNKRTVPPEFVLNAVKEYKRSDSPEYSMSSIGASECDSVHGSDSDATFEGFEHFTEEQENKLNNIGKLTTVSFCLKKRKRVRSYICHEGGCTFVGKSIRDLNEHHVNLHNNVTCETCQKMFKTPSSLKRHSYCHGELKFICNHCDDAFAFKSELNFHKTVHKKIPTFKCMFTNCNKSYKSANELNKHVLKYSGMEWECNENGCEYYTDDRRNLRAHKRKHQKTGSFKCVPCDKHFKFFMQLKRHKIKPECRTQRAN